MENVGEPTTDNKSEVLSQLEAEKESLDSSYIYARSLLEKEIEKVKSGSTGESSSSYIEAHTAKPTKLSVKVLLPVKQYPKYNFVGKLLGPGGNTLKGIQQQTLTRMAIQGRGSMRDKAKEEELRLSGGKNAHLNEDLHLQIESFSHIADAYHRMGDALEAIKPYICPELNDDTVNRAQMEMAGFTPGSRGRGRGRGGVSSLLTSPAGRGAPPAAAMEMGYDEYGGGYGDTQGYDYGADPYSAGATSAAPSAENYYSFGGGRGGAPGAGRAKAGGWGGAAANGGPKAPGMGRGRGDRVHPYGGGMPRGAGRGRAY